MDKLSTIGRWHAVFLLAKAPKMRVWRVVASGLGGLKAMVNEAQTAG
jgi:hypothetical protein